MMLARVLVDVGSPPYTWGALIEVSIGPIIQRITPIYMGSTQVYWNDANGARDHPHIHGEHPG